MILKEKSQTGSASVKHDAGIKQEQDVAFYLRRAYKDRDNVMVLNDISLSYGGETAQIDHLIVYSYGFIVVESKSIRGEVKVNKYGEWTRSYKDSWNGMPSPIKQAELQIKLLQELLKEHKSTLLGTILGIQQGFGGRCFDVFCAISSDAIIDRSEATTDVADKLVKSEFVVEALDKKMDFKSIFSFKGLLTDNRPSFNADELTKVCDFILSQQSPNLARNVSIPTNPQSQTTSAVIAEQEAGIATDTAIASHNGDAHSVCNSSSEPVSTTALAAPAISLSCDQTACKHCKSADGLTALSGRYGYFVQCAKCGGNTPLKRNCPSCRGADTKVTKSKSVYNLACQACGGVAEIFRSAG